MKRSEALAIIDKVYGEFVADWLKADISNLEGFTPINERILSALEEAGMLPPRYDFMIGEYKASDNAWEPEDEE